MSAARVVALGGRLWLLPDQFGQTRSGLYQLMHDHLRQPFDRELAGRDNGAASPALGRADHFPQNSLVLVLLATAFRAGIGRTLVAGASRRHQHERAAK